MDNLKNFPMIPNVIFLLLFKISPQQANYCGSISTNLVRIQKHCYHTPLNVPPG